MSCCYVSPSRVPVDSLRSLRVFKLFSRLIHYIFGDEQRLATHTARSTKEGKLMWITRTFGKLHEYKENKDWRHYIERVNKRRSIFLVCVGEKTYKLVQSLVAPKDPKVFPGLLRDHFMPKPSAIVQRFKFNIHSQQPGETTAMLEITLLEMLRDRLVCGVRDIRIQRWLLAESKLT